MYSSFCQLPWTYSKARYQLPLLNDSHPHPTLASVLVFATFQALMPILYLVGRLFEHHLFSTSLETRDPPSYAFQPRANPLTAEFIAKSGPSVAVSTERSMVSVALLLQHCFSGLRFHASPPKNRFSSAKRPRSPLVACC